MVASSRECTRWFLAGLGACLLACVEEPPPLRPDSPPVEQSSPPSEAPTAAAPAAPLPAATPSPPAGPPPNLLLLTLDTTRTDHLGCYGDPEARTPALDRIAERGVLFEEAYSPAPMTLPAHATLLSGVLPPQHGARVNGEHRLGDDVPSLAQELSDAGYRTGAFIAAYVLNRRFGLARGFEHYDDDLDGAFAQDVPSALARYRPGDRVVDAALEWLSDDPSQPFFAWVHLYDAHYPWYSHEPGEGHGPPGSGSYRGEIEFVDRQVQRLLDHLDQAGVLDSTLVVAVADHGEGLGDHGEIEHAYLLNEEVLHVPFLMAGPGVEAGRRVPSLVSLEDFRPTVNDLLGLPEADNVRGRSLVPALRGQEIEPGVAYAETDLPWSAYRWAPQRSLTTERWKYIRTPQAELYDRSTDRRELINLIELRPELRRDLEAELSALEAELGDRSDPVGLSETEKAQLAALGYAVGDGGAAAAIPEGPLADIKQRLPAKQLSARLREGLASGTLDPQAELQMASELVRISPETPSFHEHLGQALMRVGDIDAGIRSLRTVVELTPDDARAHYHLGDSLEQNGAPAEARTSLEKALELDPAMPAAQVGLGNVLRSEGRPDLAAARYAEAIALNEGHYPEAHFNLAMTYRDRGQPDLAEEHLRLANAQKPEWLLARSALAKLFADRGRREEAIAEYRVALRMAPGAADLYCELALLLDEAGNSEEAISLVRGAKERAPQWFRPHLLDAERLFANGRHAEALAGFERAMSLAPGLAQPACRMARFLATCPQPEHRDGGRAVALAERALEIAGPEPVVLDVLAAACAESGDYPRAIAAAHRAEQIARQRSNPALAEAIAQRIALYALEQPYHLPRSRPGDAARLDGQGPDPSATPARSPERGTPSMNR